ncbi:MAG: TasA family protein [Candidatus Planktophila sp.]
MNPMTSALSKSAGSVALKVTIVVAAAVGGAGMVASNVFAALTATATNTSGGSVTTGTLKLEYAASGSSGGFATAITAMGPGDTVNRYIDLNNTGSLDGETPTVQIASSDSNTLVNDAAKGLQLSIRACSVAWTQTGAGTCSGTETVVLASVPAATLKSAASNITLPTLLAAGTNRLKLTISLPAGNENTINGVLPVGTVQGLTAALQWSFVIQERTATNTSS